MYLFFFPMDVQQVVRFQARGMSYPTCFNTCLCDMKRWNGQQTHQPSSTIQFQRKNLSKQPNIHIYYIILSKLHCLIAHDVSLLLYTILLSYPHNISMDLVRVFKRRRHALLFHAPVGPSYQLGALRLYAEVAKALICVKPAREGHQSHIHKPNFFTAEVRLLSKLSFQ